MERDPEDAEQLRRRLYRPGASPDDLASYLRAAEGTDEPVGAHDPANPAVHRTPGRAVLIGSACVVLAAAAGLAIGGFGAGPRPTPTTSPTVRVVAQGDGTWTVGTGDVPVLDGGDRAGARGTSVQEGPDMVRYTLDTGDRAGAVAARFGLCLGDVLVALPYGVDPGSLPAGATLELHRVTTC